MIVPLLVRERRDIESGVPLPPSKAPWAEDEKKTWWVFFQVLLRMIILIFLPGVTIVIAMSLGQPVIVVVVFMLLLFSLLVGSIGRGLYALEDMGASTQKVPLLPAAIAVVSRFQEHYFNHRTWSVFYYLLYPVLGPISFIVSRAARQEFRPFLSLFTLVAIAVLIQNVVNYQSIFPLPYFHHNTYFGLLVCAGMVATGIALCFVCLVPIVSSSFYLSVTGRGVSLRTSAALALVISASAMFWNMTATSVTFRGALTSMEKMNNADFRDHFVWQTTHCLQREIENRTINNHKLWAAKMWGSFEAVMEDLDLPVVVLRDSTEWYRDFMGGCLRAEEAAAFRIVEIDPGDDSPKWLGVLYIPEPTVGFGGFMGEAVLLFAVAPDKTIYDKWENLPPWFNRVFSEVPRLDPPNRFEPHKLTTKSMFLDFDFEGARIPSFGAWPRIPRPTSQPQS